MEEVVAHLTRSIRSLRRAPLFTSIVVVLLTSTAVAAGFGITLVDAVFLRPLPYADPSTMAVIMGAANEDCDAACPDLLPLEQFNQIEQQVQSFSSLASIESRDFLLGGRDEASHLAGAVVGARFFQVLGVVPRLGRTLTLADSDPQAAPALVLGDGAWRRAFGADPEVVGKVVPLAGRVYTIVGVMPPEFSFPIGANLWVPRAAVPPAPAPGSRFVAGLGRLRTGTALEQARAELKVLARRSQPSTTIASLRTSISARPFIEDARVESPYVALILGAVGLLILVSFAALQTLAIVRVLGYRTTLAVRAAIGATSRQLMSASITEGMMLAALSLVAAMVVLSWLVSSAPLWLPATAMVGGLTPRGIVLAPVALGMLLLAGLAFGPAAVIIVRATTSSILGVASGTVSPPRQAIAVRKLAVGIQIGLGVVFLTVALTLGRTIVNLRRADLGYDRSSLIIAPLDLRHTPFDRTDLAHGLAEALVQRLGSAPGVSAATAWNVAAPSMMVNPGESFATVEGGVEALRYSCRRPSDCSFPMMRYGVTKAFFQATGVQIVSGRAFEAGDVGGASPVAIISEQAAIHWWPGKSPLGRRFKFGAEGSPFPWLTVVGVAANTQPIDEWGIIHGAVHPGQYYPLIFQPLSQVDLGPSGRPEWTSSLIVGIRGKEAATQVSGEIRTAIRELAPTVVTGRVGSMQEIHSSIDVFDQVRLGAWAASIACALAVALTLLSIGGLVAENIRARTREFGIRLAVGASPARLRRATARDISGLAVIATLVAGAAGLVFRYPLSRAFYGATEQFKDGMLFGTTPHLAPTLLAAAAALCTLVIACAWVSTRTLQHLDPAALLREQ